MTSHEIQALADVLKEDKPRVDHPYYPSVYAQWLKSVQSVAAVCEESSETFNRDRFLEACDV